jgi:UDP-N-acetylglucosamine 2-epimerase (non-hydrolysing)
VTGPRNIGVVTGSRADYGLLRGLLQAIREDSQTVYSLFVTGSHLEESFGHTISEISRDGFEIAAQIPLDISNDSRLDTARAMSRALDGVAASLDAVKPDLVVVLGDRYEILAAASAALVLDIPVAHIHGGEITEGALDDSMRHMITKAAYLHFTAAEDYSRRVIQMGEAPDRVFTVGALGVDNIRDLAAGNRKTLNKILGVPLGEVNFLVTYHPVTAGRVATDARVNAMIAALEYYPEARIIVTGVNADPGRVDIARELAAFSKRRPHTVTLHESLGNTVYLQVMQQADLVIGNSSSGLIEAPAMGVPTVNIGPRQDGRLRAESVVDCENTVEDISRALSQGLSEDMKDKAAEQYLPYGSGNAAAAILVELKSQPLPSPVRKKFYERAAP